MAFDNRPIWRRRQLHAAADRLLGGLGDSAAAVASGLARSEVQGLPGNAQDCAIARYLQAVVGAEASIQRVEVLENRIRVMRSGLRPPIVLPVPPAIAAFVRGFDAGCFPDLIARQPGSSAGRPVSLEHS